MIKSVSVTDVAHNPENNQRAVELLIGQGISSSMIVPHLASIAHTKEEADEKIKFFRDSGVKTMFVIRGNPLVIEKDMSYTQHPQGYENPGQLIKRIKELAPAMQVIVAGYPEKHPYSNGFEEGLDELKQKVDFGADMIMTQHFFHNKNIINFVDGCQKRGIYLPIIPTIMPIGNPKYLFSFSKEAGVDIPAEIIQILFQKEGVTVSDSSIKDKKTEEEAVAYTANQIKSLLDINLSQIIRINTHTANNIPFLMKVFEALEIGKETDKEKGNCVG